MKQQYTNVPCKNSWETKVLASWKKWPKRHGRLCGVYLVSASCWLCNLSQLQAHTLSTGVKTLGTLGQMFFKAQQWSSTSADLDTYYDTQTKTMNTISSLPPLYSYIMLYDVICTYLIILARRKHIMRVCRNTSWSGLMVFHCFYEKLKNIQKHAQHISFT